MKTIQDALDAYLQRGFGSMNKNDFEVWIFHQLLQSTLKGKSNFIISRELRIPESKVKRLRYEANLRYYDENDGKQPFLDAFKTILKNATVKKDGQKISFAIEDTYIRKQLEADLKQSGRFLDSSFNSEIVTMSQDDLFYLIEEYWGGSSELIDKFEDKLQEVISDAIGKVSPKTIAVLDITQYIFNKVKSLTSKHITQNKHLPV